MLDYWCLLLKAVMRTWIITLEVELYWGGNSLVERIRWDIGFPDISRPCTSEDPTCHDVHQHKVWILQQAWEGLLHKWAEYQHCGSHTSDNGQSWIVAEQDMSAPTLIFDSSNLQVINLAIDEETPGQFKICRVRHKYNISVCFLVRCSVSCADLA